MIQKSYACALALCLLLGSACATGRPSGPALATLEVENRTPESLRVSVRGRVEGTVGPGTRLRVRNLATGPAELIASGVGAGAAVHRAEATLRSDELHLWTLSPDLGREPLPEVAPLGSLKVENPNRADLAVAVYGPDRKLLDRGRVFAGGTRTFVDLPSGPVLVEAVPEPAGATVRAELEVLPDAAGQAVWRYTAEGARLTIVNTTDEAIEIALDGAERGRIPPQGELELVEAAGSRVVTARSVPSRRPYEAVVTLTRDEPARWEVHSGQAQLAIENRAGEALTVWTRVRGAAFPEAGTALEVGQTLELGEVVSGIHEIAAVGARSNLRYTGVVEVGVGQAGTFVVGPVFGTVRVDNRTGAPLTLYVTELDGAERLVGEVPAEQVVFVRELARGPVALRAVRLPSSLGVGLATADSGSMGPEAAETRLYSTRLDLGASPAATWVIGERVGSIRVENRGDEAVEAFADGARLGDVPAQRTRVFTGVSAGARQVDAVGKKSGEAWRRALTVPEDGVASVELEASAGHLDIENGTSEPLSPRGLLAGQAELIEPGETRRFRVRAGPVTAILTGRETGYRYGATVAVPPGEVARWVAQVTPGRLIIWSRLAESVAVTFGETAQGTVAPDESLVLDDLAPGLYRVQTVGLRSGRVKAYDVMVSPETDRKLTLSVELGVVLIENTAREAVEVSIDGELYGRVEAGRLHAFGRVPPGLREVTLDFPRSRRSQRVAVELREGQRVRVTAHSPEGLLVVDNASGEALQVTVDDRVVARIAENSGPTFVNAPAGPRHVRIERMRSRTAIGFTVDILADHAIHLPVPSPAVRLVVVNRTEGSLELVVDDAVLRTLAGRSSEMIEGLGTGEVRLVARDERGLITHEERRKLRAGETAAWVLD